MKSIWKVLLPMLCVLCMTMLVPERAYAVEGIQATATAVASDKIELKWEAMEGAEQYVIYRRTSSEGKFRKIKITSDTVFRDDISAAINYYYQIVPVSSASGKEMKNARITLKAKAPAQVSIDKVSVKAPTKIQLYWTASEGGSGYQIFRGQSKNGKYKEIARVEGKATCTYIDEAVVPGKVYYYKIRPSSQGQLGSGTYSEPVKGKTVAKTGITSIISKSADRLKINWRKVAGANTYEVYRSTKAEGGFRKIATVKNSSNEYIDKTVKSGKKYYYKIVVTADLDGTRITSGYSEAAEFRALNTVEISSVKATKKDGLNVKWLKVKGATKYDIYRSTTQRSGFKKIATVKAKGAPILSYEDTEIDAGKTYYYKVQAYSDEKGMIAAGVGGKSSAESGKVVYEIMGETSVTAEQMIEHYNASGRTFPSQVYKSKGAKNLKKFCDTIINESKKEGVKAEVIFAQICVETGYLQFGGQVSAEQCNFSGLGATDDGAAGATFPNVKIGIRAQVQHLKGYASKDALNQECVDPRFSYLSFKRGTAKYVQDLGGGNWATDPDYASKLMAIIKDMKN